jgi:hypothetical protein
LNKKFFQRHIALPGDHGSWVFLLSPLAIGLFAGGTFSQASLLLIVAALAAFLIRQPITIVVKVLSGRRGRQELPTAWFWIAVYGVVGLLALAGLIGSGFAYLLWLAVPGLPVFAWHLFLVSRRAERRQAGFEIVATGALALAAPAAFWVGKEALDPGGWWLFVLCWLQSAASIVYAYLRLAQRDLTPTPTYPALFRLGWRSLLYTSFNLLGIFILTSLGILSRWLFLPYLLQWAETIWGVTHPAIGWKPTRVGVRQLIVSILFTILFILVW